ncbi:MAG: hypothetical protein AMXMBFR7_33400 [Planctomycetota bacterium]
MSTADRTVRVVSISKEGLEADTREQAVAAFLGRLDQAASYKPDIVCLPENTPGREAQDVPGSATEPFAAWAREHRCWLILPLIARENGALYNTALLFDRDGKLAGRYRKIHPTETELERGIRPGAPEGGVFRTDFGTIGVRICFDVNWWEDWSSLKAQGAQLVFFSSAYSANRILSALALRNRFYVVSSTRSRLCRAYDITGDELDRSGIYRPWVQTTLNLGKRLFETDYQLPKLRELAAKYGDRVEVKWFHEEDWFTLASYDPERSTEDLMREYGLTAIDEYHARCSKAQAAAPAAGA